MPIRRASDCTGSSAGQNEFVAEYRAARSAAARPVRSVVRRVADFITSAYPQEPVSRRGVVMDVTLAATATVAVLATVSQPSGLLMGPVQVLSGGTQSPLSGSDMGLGAMLLAVLTTAPLALRRIRPLAAFWLIVIAAAMSPHYAANVVTLAAVVLAAYSALAHSRYRGAAIVSMPASGWLDAIYLHDHPASSLPHSGSYLLVLVPVLVAALTVSQWRRRAAESSARLLRLQAEHEAATEAAVKQERARIATELHDVVTHNVSVMIVQAGAARQVLGQSPDQARAALLAVESSGRAAMAELRHLLGLLSPPDQAGESAADPHGADPGLRPQPGLARLVALVDRVRAAGLPVELDVSGLPPDLPPGLEVAAYRIVQEALTNVIKHAGKPRTSVRVGCQAGHLVIEVADAGRTMAVVGPVGASLPGSGRGLVGMRERAALYGGDLQAGSRPGGGWLVTARIPVDPGVLELASQQPGALGRRLVPAAQ
jgi:signal transduction histidine kinase